MPLTDAERRFVRNNRTLSVTVTIPRDLFPLSDASIEFFADQARATAVEYLRAGGMESDD